MRLVTSAVADQHRGRERFTLIYNDSPVTVSYYLSGQTTKWPSTARLRMTHFPREAVQCSNAGVKQN